MFVGETADGLAKFFRAGLRMAKRR
jgi:hypothetical protein